METLFLIAGIIVILFAINSLKNKTIKRLDNLEDKMNRLQEMLSKPKLQEQPEKKTEAPSLVVVPRKENFEHERYMQSYTQKEEPAVPIIQKKEEESVTPMIRKEEVIIPPKPQPEKHVAASVTTKPVTEKEKKDFEKFIGENLLSKIGIATLVLGIAYFVKYAIDQNWINEIGRVSIGIFLGGTVIAIAHKLKNTYRTFSSILVGGGISILYITIAIAFHDYQLFSQTLSFVLLILITIFSTCLSILYDRKELAIFALLGGFASPLLVSTGVGNYIVLFSYMLILNTGMLILTFKKQWKIVGIIAYILTQLFYWTWLIFSFDSDKQAGAICFIFLFFLQFYLLALIDHYRSSRNITPFQVFTILSNNLSLFASAIYIFNNYPINVKGLITVIIAVLNAIPMILLFKDKKIDKRLIYLLIAIVLTFASLAVPIQLNGCAITMFWAVETVILLWLWQKSGIRLFKYGFVVIELLVMISLLMDWFRFYAEEIQILPIIFNKPFITGLIITATVWVNAYLLRKETSKAFLPGSTFNPSRLFPVAGTLLLFFTLFWELQHQMNQYYEPQTFRLMIYGLYCYTFIGILTLIRWNKGNWKSLIYWILIIATVLYVLPYNFIVYSVRAHVINGYLSQWGYFVLHYLTLPSLILFFAFLLKKNKEIITNHEYQPSIYWFTTIISVIILSCETDHAMLMLFFNDTNKYDLLQLSHNIIYPILWGIISFILMLIGMKQKNRTLRIISLSLFALIILKLYVLDVWEMEQTGRIIAFIFLGIILLLVSFLYQKLKVLLMKNEENQKNKEE